MPREQSIVASNVRKRCAVCRSEKPLEEFHADGRSGDGRVTRCKVCVSDYCRVRKAATYDRWGKASREWPTEFATHPGRPGVVFGDYPHAEGYKVGDDGTAWSRNGTHSRYGKYWHQLNTSVRARGHLAVNMMVDGKLKGRYVHRLVLETFVGPCPEGMECRHVLNNDPTDNRLVNLAWGTKEENAADKRRHGTNLDGSRNPNALLTESDILAIRALAAGGSRLVDIGREYGIEYSGVCKIVKHKSWKHVP